MLWVLLEGSDVRSDLTNEAAPWGFDFEKFVSAPSTDMNELSKPLHTNDLNTIQ